MGQTAFNNNAEGLINDLTCWVNSVDVLKSGEEGSVKTVSLEPILGDAGFRQYFRLKDGPLSALAVYAPPKTEKNQQFVSIADFLGGHGVRVPKVYAVDFERGFLLIEDFGDQLLHPLLNGDTVQGLYGEVLMALLHCQSVKPCGDIFPCYSAELLRTELRVFSDWFVAELLEYSVSQEESEVIESAFDALVANAVSQPQVIVHRDFHSRNILIGTAAGGCETPGFIDFQDAVLGPITYDLVSLIKDCYIRWPDQQVEQWALAYGNLLLDAGLIPNVSQQQFLRWFDLMGLQRHIKVLGVFSRLSRRDGKHGYLKDLPLVIEYVRTTLTKYPEFAAFSAWFDETLLPLYRRWQQ